MIDYAKLESCLAGCEIGHTVYTHARCHSTQDIAHAIAASHRSGTLVLAELQTKGRGRSGRTWTDRRGRSLTTSFLLKTPWGIGNSAPTSLMAGMAVLEAISESIPEIGRNLWLKWPNDIVWRGQAGLQRKLAGILVETHYQGAKLKHTVLGIGVNVNHSAGELPKVEPPSLTPSSLRLLAGEQQDRLKLLVSLCQQLASWLSPDSPCFLPDRPWEEKMITLGQQVVVHPNASNSPTLMGIATGTTKQGSLIVVDAAGHRHEITAADVSIRG